MMGAIQTDYGAVDYFLRNFANENVENRSQIQKEFSYFLLRIKSFSFQKTIWTRLCLYLCYKNKMCTPVEYQDHVIGLISDNCLAQDDLDLDLIIQCFLKVLDNKRGTTNEWEIIRSLLNCNITGSNAVIKFRVSELNSIIKKIQRFSTFDRSTPQHYCCKELMRRIKEGYPKQKLHIQGDMPPDFCLDFEDLNKDQ